MALTGEAFVYCLVAYCWVNDLQLLDLSPVEIRTRITLKSEEQNKKKKKVELHQRNEIK